MTRTFYLSQRMRYPFVVAKILKEPGAAVSKTEPLFEFRYEWKTAVVDSLLNEVTEHVESGIGVWESPAEGVVSRWCLAEGDVVVRSQAAVAINEACDHAVQFEGLCAKCGKDMTEVNWASDKADTQRATINMTHDQTRLLVSGDVAKSADSETKRRLLKQRKLILVVDLDQTIIHACTDPTVADWKANPENPNHEAVKDVHEFKLNDGPKGVLLSDCSYYIKVRPGCHEFLDEIAAMYELHIYTMATRAYAQNIAKIIDPTGKLFGNRIISRDENLTMHSKRLQRLFPVSTNMVAIIDDRSDMWPDDRDNLIRATPYEFFTGIGDINSSFLPTREDLLPGAASANRKLAAAAAPSARQLGSRDAATSSNTTTTISPAENDEALQAEQVRIIERQITERPLQHLQEELDKETESEEPGSGENGQPAAQSQASHHQRHHVLQDNDEELIHLQGHLTRLHSAYFKEYDAICAKAKAKAKGRGHAPFSLDDDNINIDLAPDLGMVLNELKGIVLEGANIVFSALLPMGVDVSETDLGMRTMSFGAQLHNELTSSSTHLVVSTHRPRTQKFYQACKHPYIKIVNHHWLNDCMSQWRWLDERPYLVPVNPADRCKLNTVDAANRDWKDMEDADGDDKGDETGSVDDDLSSSPFDQFSNIDWDAINEELKELLSGEDDDEDRDTDTDTDSKTLSADEGNATNDDTDAQTAQQAALLIKALSQRGMKRKASMDDDDDSENDTSSPDAARKRLMAERSQGSPNQATDQPRDTGSTGDGDDDDNSDDDDDHDDDDEDDNGLEAALLAEFEAAEKEAAEAKLA